MIDHIGVNVGNFETAKAFYAAALAPLGIGLLAEYPAAVTGSVDVAGFGEPGKPVFWISAPHAPGASASATTPASSQAASQVHVAFQASTRALVDAFYRAALDAGGRDNGAPGIRAHYHPDYYGAFVLDPSGHNIEAVCHLPQ